MFQAARLALGTSGRLAGCHGLRLSILLCHLAPLYLGLCCFVSIAKQQNRIMFLATNDVRKTPSLLSARAFFLRSVPSDKQATCKKCPISRYGMALAEEGFMSVPEGHRDLRGKVKEKTQTLHSGSSATSSSKFPLKE